MAAWEQATKDRKRIVSNAGDHLFLVVNAGCRDADLAHLRAGLEPAVRVTELADMALLALQGPAAVTVLARLAPACAGLPFMGTAEMDVDGLPCRVSRLGYTGEDGFEISVASAEAEALARALLAEPEVAPAGLGARDTLRLEAGLCLYGHDIDTTTTPVQAGLTWAIQKVRRPGGERAGGYLGAEAIAAQLANGAPTKRVGLVGLERVPVREGAHIVDDAGAAIGRVTSGTVGPSVGQPIAMAYVPSALAIAGTVVHADVRGKRQPMRVSPLPFAPHRYFRG
jgi:aminomethyltransferase